MEYNTPKVYFILKTQDISVSDNTANYPLSNTIGSINQYRTSITWNAINIKNLLGDLYDKYDMFTIQLELNGQCVNTTNFGTTVDDRLVRIQLSGLDWVYSNYDTIKGGMTTSAVCNNNIYLIDGTASTGNQNYWSYNIFRKCITADLTIDLLTVLGTLPDNPVNTIFPQMRFDFVISPI